MPQMTPFFLAIQNAERENITSAAPVASSEGRCFETQGNKNVVCERGGGGKNILQGNWLGASASPRSCAGAQSCTKLRVT